MMSHLCPRSDVKSITVGVCAVLLLLHHLVRKLVHLVNMVILHCLTESHSDQVGNHRHHHSWSCTPKCFSTIWLFCSTTPWHLGFCGQPLTMITSLGHSHHTFDNYIHKFTTIVWMQDLGIKSELLPSGSCSDLSTCRCCQVDASCLYGQSDMKTLTQVSTDQCWASSYSTQHVGMYSTHLSPSHKPRWDDWFYWYLCGIPNTAPQTCQ